MEVQYMKKTILSAVAVALVVTAFGCGAGADADTPDAIALRFMEHVVRAEYEEASALGTESTQELLSFLVMMTSGMSREELQEEIGTPDEISVVSSEIDGDDAIVVLSSGGEEEEVNLKKIDGDWKVDLDKESMDKDF
jgi:hypothetical protein